MRRDLFPAPLLSAALFVSWLLLNESLAPGELLLGAVVAIAAPWLSAPLRPVPVRIRGPHAVLRLVGRVVQDVIVSNAQVAWRVVSLRRGPPRAAFVAVPLELRDPNALAALAIITTIVPGTVWSELALDRSVLLLHVFDIDDGPAFVAHFKARYEEPLREIFE